MAAWRRFESTSEEETYLLCTVSHAHFKIHLYRFVISFWKLSISGNWCTKKIKTIEKERLICILLYLTSPFPWPLLSGNRCSMYNNNYFKDARNAAIKFNNLSFSKHTWSSSNVQTSLKPLNILTFQLNNISWTEARLWKEMRFIYIFSYLNV